MTASDVVCGTEAHVLSQQGPVSTLPTPNLKVSDRLIAMIAH